MMTEDEAKQRWCPLVRFKSRDTGSGPAFNRYTGWQDNPYTDLMCVGSKCMAWTWDIVGDESMPGQGHCGAFGGQSNG